MELKLLKEKVLVLKKELDSLEDKYLKKTMIKIIDSNNKELINEFLDFLNKNDIMLSSTQFLYQKLYYIDNIGIDEELDVKYLYINYSIFTETIISEIRNKYKEYKESVKEHVNLRKKIYGN